MKKTIKDLYDYFDKKYSSDEALASLITLYGIYNRYSDVDKSDYEYSLIKKIVEDFANLNTSNVKYAYTDNNREQAYQQALEEFIKNSKIDMNNFDDWLEQAKDYKNDHDNIFYHWDVLKISKDKTYEVIGLRDFLDDLFGTECLTKLILEFLKTYQKANGRKESK